MALPQLQCIIQNRSRALYNGPKKLKQFNQGVATVIAVEKYSLLTAFKEKKKKRLTHEIILFFPRSRKQCNPGSEK